MRKRPLPKVLAIVAGLLVVLVLVPGLVSVQPEVLGGDARLREEHDTWIVSKHADVSCGGCHAAPTVTAQVAFDAEMLGGLYATILGQKRDLTAFAKPVNAACTQCHKDLITTSPKGDLIIPHTAHTEVLKVRCVVCHQYLVHAVSPEGKHTPPMATCLKCHDGKKAKNACATCHTGKSAPASHEDTATWLAAHPSAAASDTAACAKCHGWTKNWCADCHSRRPVTHTADWRKTHGAAVAARDPRDCETCHTASFCSNCHGIVPQLNYDPNVTLVR